MLKNFLKNTVLFPITIGIVFLLFACGSGNKSEDRSSKSGEMLQQAQHDIENTIDKEIIVGANQTESYLPLFNGKKVG